MKAIMIMYDSLNRNMLEPYGCDWTKTPNFKRLAEHSVQFERCYVGSMPCMPARRELHTGRTNFLHRGWGPLEPFDDSMPELLKKNGIYTHLVSDHQHYWEDGGATYHTRYSSWESVRGQEGDPWKALLSVKASAKTAFENKMMTTSSLALHDEVNRRFIDCEEKMPQALTFKSGLEFLQDNHTEDNWFVQIETFDPHEPFYTTEEYKNLYPDNYHGAKADWPPYYFVQEDGDTVSHVRNEYAALLSMCDHYLGKVLDFMDENDMWKDTMLIVNTDHGYLLGEHGWWSKSVMPVYNEIANTPLFVWDPRLQQKNIKRNALVQTIDLAPTLLEFFNQPIPSGMEGKPLRAVIENDTPIRNYAVFGYHGGQVNITDGVYTYMRSPINIDNKPLYEYTLMPTHMRTRFAVAELQDLQLQSPFTFTKGCKTLKINSSGGLVNPFQYGNKLFNIADDPHQLTQLDEVETEVKLILLLSEYFKRCDAPKEQYERLGIPVDNAFTTDDLANQRQHINAQMQPAFIDGFVWQGTTGYQIQALLRLMPDKQDMLLAGFTQFVSQQNPSKTVTQEHINAFLKMALQGDILEMAQYAVALLARSN